MKGIQAFTFNKSKTYFLVKTRVLFEKNEQNFPNQSTDKTDDGNLTFDTADK